LEATLEREVAPGDMMEGKKRTTMSFVRIAASAVIFTALSAACAMAKPVVTSGDTNLRKAPGTENPVLH
jgi:hypothetical protein